MCGIAGTVNYKLAGNEVNKIMIHRGPDEQNEFSESNVQLFHLRLSIMDISGGKQPMQLNDRYTIIYNGEIYNHQEIRDKFNLKGNTSSDTETLLLLYERSGTSFLDHLDGMFVFVIYDKVENTLFIARDRAGKKPLYIYRNNDKLVFASELNCLKHLLPLEMNNDNFHHYTRFGTFYKGMTPYKNVTELGAGTFLTVNCASMEITERKWWNIHEHYLSNQPGGINENLEKADSLLKTAVRRRLESSDLEVGCFLSGGIDSGLVTAIASQQKNRIKTFTVSFPGAYDEAPLAKLVAEKYGTDHTEINISFDHLKDDVEQIIANYGEPFFDSSAIPSYYVSREAKKHVTVILNGDGADELFGGYRRYVPFSKYDFFKENAGVKLVAKGLSAVLPMPKDKRSRYNYIYRLASLASKSNIGIYLSAGVDIMEGYEDALIDPGFDYLKGIRSDFDKVASSELTGLKKLMNLDFDTNLFSDLLVKMDIATMANSLEGRSPFLSKELLEYVPGLNDDLKIRGGTTKFLLRTLSEKYLPSQLIHQPKRGFEIPLKNWVNFELKDIIHDHINASSSINNLFFKKDFTSKLLQDKLPVPPEKRAKILWMIFCMEVWYKKCYLNQ